MHQSHARALRVEEQYRSGEGQIDDRERARRAMRDLELEMAASDVVAAPTHRRPRTTGAAAQYARSDSAATRRTIQISGHGAPVHRSALRPTPSELRGPRPDRIAGWAVGLGLLVAVLAALL
jgi:hypothetical protein